MPHYHQNPSILIGKPKAGDGDCVDLIRVTVDSLKEVPTRNWRPGERVLDTKNLKPGTAIATFICGKYPQDGHTGKHAAIFLRYWGPPNSDGTYDAILVVDQWKTRSAILSRQLHKKGYVPRSCSGGIYDASNSLDAFYVIEGGKK